MIFETEVTGKVDLKYLHIIAFVRYWEDAFVNNIEDTDGKLIPCREGDSWNPTIDIDEGKIINWEQGKQANIHYKIADAGSYYLTDAKGNTILKIEDDYVISSLAINENGYGDYIIMDVDEKGYIQDWEFNIDDFTDA